ncbi:MAG: GAF domain-containing protein [Candidatus Dadabacteria bacterium]|nr:GAF domain-containing protein [Candidatus Dadabacteria bacterium]NIS08885.1 GAF domain-containing protein [Candidatus Dadabacteria bacterium]NIV42584.1 GAF domain-containing protein [Candidatus Dadabacteria bacterium]NIY22228.1 GAF domain-containing protein [Candidatus Dadabacteria bacterium]
MSTAKNIELESNEQVIKDFFKSALDSEPDGILIIDHKGKFLYHNKKFLEVWKISSELLETEDKSQVFNYFNSLVKDSENYNEKFSHLIKNKNEDTFEILEFKDGRIFEKITTPQRLHNKIIGRVCIFKDITRSRRSEKTLEETLVKLSVKNRNEEVINNILKDIHKTIDLKEVLKNVSDSLYENLDSINGVEIYIAEKDEAILKACAGLPEWYLKQFECIKYPEGIVWNIISSGKAKYCEDLEKEVQVSPEVLKLGTKSCLSLPIKYRNETIGCINIHTMEKDAFNEDELRLLEIVSKEIEVSVNNAKQAEELRTALDELEKLKNQLHHENIYLKEEIKLNNNFEEIIGENDELKKILHKVEIVAPTDSAVLILGETGTGKELIARAIHNLSSRKPRSFVKVNCGAISPTLIESELFGHEKGSFTGAVNERTGRFEIADGGTIFLDEISELSLELQVKLLRVLQEGEFERVGSSVSKKVDVRIIAATNKDLEILMKEGEFRADLFYRLNVVPIEVPSLRERKSDIPLLVNYFVSQYSKKLGKKIKGVSSKSLDRLMNYNWPGNIRELQNVLERNIVLSQGSTLNIEDKFINSIDLADNEEGMRLENIERSHIIKVLEKTKWRVHGSNGAASYLDLNPSTLRARMRKLGIERPKKLLTENY